MRLTIQIDSRQAVYYSGQTISGRVFLDTGEEITRVRSVSVTFRGSTVVRWTEGSGEHQSTYHKEEEYFKFVQPLCGNVNSKSTFCISKGNYSYPFQFVVPQDIPSSYQSSVGNVNYTLTSTIDRNWGFNKNCVVYITVHRPLDLNTIQNITGTAEGAAEKNLCCLCCRSGPIAGVLHVERRGYVPGDRVAFSGQIENSSSRKISNINALLVMKVEYYAGKAYVIEHVLERIHYREEVPAGGSRYITGKILIPAGPPSYLDKCNIIFITYFVRLVVKAAGPSMRLNVSAEIVIGDIPLQNHGASRNLYDRNNTQAMPQVSYAESPLGRPLYPRRHSNTHGQTDFVPVYSYYKWDRANPADNFTV